MNSYNNNYQCNSSPVQIQNNDGENNENELNKDAENSEAKKNAEELEQIKKEYEGRENDKDLINSVNLIGVTGARNKRWGSQRYNP